jgi:hypothetical protein
MTSSVEFYDQPAMREGEIWEVATDRGLVGIAPSGSGVIIEELFQSKLTRRSGGLEIATLAR